jgi:hypothetical protein
LRGGILYTVIGVLVIIVVIILVTLFILSSINPEFPENLL